MSSAVEAQIDALLASYPAKQAATLTQLRKKIKLMVPGATERISYGMPTFEVAGQILIHFCGFKTHNSIFPGAETSRRMKPLLGDMVTSKGTIQFGLERLPADKVLRQILRTRIDVINASYPKKSGEFLNLYDNGRVKSRGKYRAGKMDGQWEFFRRDGSLMRSGRLDNDKPTGTWTTGQRVAAAKAARD